MKVELEMKMELGMKLELKLIVKLKLSLRKYTQLFQLAALQSIPVTLDTRPFAQIANFKFKHFRFNSNELFQTMVCT